MPMANSYLAALRDAGQALITHIAIVDGSGAEIAGIARQAVTWSDEGVAVSRMVGDKAFGPLPSGQVVAGWRGFTALTGGTNHGGDDFTAVTFGTGAGVTRTFTLQASQTSIDHTAVA